MKLFIDFETRSEADLPKCGQSVYARHPSTLALCLAYAPYGETPRLWRAGEDMPADLAAWIADDTVEVHAHNAGFEKAIWQHVMVARHGWPPIAEKRWHCTAARVAALAMPRSLEGAGEAIGLPIKKDLDGRRVMMSLSKPRKPTKNNPELWHNDPAMFETLYAYCKTDVAAEMAVHDATPDLHPRERLTWLLDQRINDRGIPVDRPTIRGALAIEVEQTARLEAELTALTGGEVTTGRQTARLVKWLSEKGVNVADMTKESVGQARKTPGLPAELDRVLEIRQQLSRASVAKFQAMDERADDDDRIRGAHLYHGASTGRWSGQGVQFQNIPRGGLTPADLPVAIDAVKTGSADVLAMLYGDVAAPLTGVIRSMVKAPAGSRLLVSDFAGIEARVLAWLADETKLLQVFHEGGDVYKVAAGDIYQKPAESVTKGERQLGKVAVLGLGYGMGAGKFIATAATYGITIDEDFSSNVVDIYRTTNARIRNFWYALGDAAKDAALGQRRAINKLRLYRDGRFLFIELPSGRRLAYCDPQVRDEQTPIGVRPQLSYMGVDSLSRKWVRQRTYGGKLVENVVQAVARDFLVDAMFRLERRGYPIIFHVHDEAVVELPYGQGSIGEMEAIMSELPAWGSGCPIGAEGFESERYRK